MTENDIKVLRHGGEVRTYRAYLRNGTTAANTAMKPGELVKDSENYAHLLATGDPEIGTDIFIGVVARESTETLTVTGDVEVTTMDVGTILRGKATTTTNINTLAKIRAYLQNYIGSELTALSGTNGVYTFDEDHTDDPNKDAFRIIDGDPINFTLDVLVHILSTENAGGQVGQTIE